MIYSALAAVAVGWFLRDFWFAFVAGLGVSYASAMFNWVAFTGRPELNEFQFRTILAGFLAGLLGVVIAFLRTAYDEYRAERLKAAMRRDGPPRAGEAQPKMSTTVRRRLKLVDAKAKRLGNDMSNLSFSMVDRWVNRASYRDAERERGGS